jgi:hypothetical protein
VLAVAQAILEQVGAAIGAAIQQREAIARIGVLAHHHDADLGVRLTQPVGEGDPLVVAGRRHADVRHHDVGHLGVDRLDELAPVSAHSH